MKVFMTIFKRIDIDMEAERARVNKVFKGRQRKALLKLYDAFEAGDFQKCLDLVNDKKEFPYNEKGEYPEVEHIGTEVHRVLSQVASDNFYTQCDLLHQAEQKILESKTTTNCPYCHGEGVTGGIDNRPCVCTRK